MTDVLGLILARGGSVRVKRKNVRPLGGVPLVAWTIHAGRTAMTLDGLAVSSEDDEILRISQEHGADVIKRPKKMATNEASPYPAILHALGEYDVSFDYVCLLQPTSPFRVASHIDDCVTQAISKDLHAVVSVTKGKHVPNGAIYVGRVDWLRDAVLRHKWPFDTVLNTYEMDVSNSIDIDVEEDFQRAQQMVSERLVA